MRYAQTLSAAALMLMGSAAYAAGPADTAPTSSVSGTIEGEVKKVDPNVVIIEKESKGKDNGAEVRLPLSDSTHKGPISEGDKVEAFVTPGGTTTSVQPKKDGLNR